MIRQARATQGPPNPNKRIETFSPHKSIGQSRVRWDHRNTRGQVTWDVATGHLGYPTGIVYTQTRPMGLPYICRSVGVGHEGSGWGGSPNWQSHIVVFGIGFFICTPFDRLTTC